MPKISVIIPIYNVENYLEECLDSVVGQTLDDIEIICVDDGSPDRSAEIAARYVEKYENVKLIRKENGGQSSARNKALEVASGTYVYFIDSDDLIEKDALELLYHRAEEDQLDIIFFNTVPFFENEEIKAQNKNYVNFYNRSGDYSGVHTGQQLFGKMRRNGEFFGSPCLELFRRSLIEENHLRFYEGIIHEDNLFTFQAIMLAKRAGYMDKAFYHRRVHDNSTMTTKKSMRNVEGYLVSYEEMLSFLQGREIEQDVVRNVSEYLYNAIYKNAQKIYFGLDIKDNEAVLSKGGIVARHFLDNIKKEKLVDKDNKKNKQKAVSLDYRVGNKLLVIPRKIKGVLRYVKKHGILYIAKRGLKKVSKYTKNFRKVYVKLKLKAGLSFKPLISIIMPVYNVEPYIKQGLDSLLNQTMKHIEIIAVDDGSTDRSLEILNEYAKKDRRVRVFTQENKFAGAARNLGLANANGEYVIFLDSDDFFSEKLAEEAYYAAKLNRADVVLWGAKHYNNATGEYKEANWLLNAKVSPRGEAFDYTDCPKRLYQITTPCPWTKMFRRKFVLENGLQFQNLRNSNDLFFTYSALAMAKRIYTVDKILVYYRVGLENNLQATKKKSPLCFLEAYQAWHDKLVELGKLETLRQSYVNVALSGCLYNLRSLKDLDSKKIVFDKLKNEAFKSLEITNSEPQYYYNKQNYEDMVLIKNQSFEQYIEATKDR